MRLYLLTAPGAIRYAGSQAEVRDHRKQLVEITGCKKADVTVEEVEIKTSKPEVLKLINGLCEKSD